MAADAQGRYGFWSIKPVPYPIPNDGPVGELLDAARRSPMRPAHIHFMVSATGYRTLVTHIFADDSNHLDSDAVFGVKESLLGTFSRQDPGSGPANRILTEPWWQLTFDIRLAKEPS